MSIFDSNKASSTKNVQRLSVDQGVGTATITKPEMFETIINGGMDLMSNRDEPELC